MSHREVKRASIIKYTAEIEGISTESVRRVLNDKQVNEDVYSTYLLVEEEIEKTIDHVKLVRSVEKLIPFVKADLSSSPKSTLLSV